MRHGNNHTHLHISTPREQTLSNQMCFFFPWLMELCFFFACTHARVCNLNTNNMSYDSLYLSDEGLLQLRVKTWCSRLQMEATAYDVDIFKGRTPGSFGSFLFVPA